MIQITWTDVTPTQIDGSVNGVTWFRLRRTSTPFADNVWQITPHLPFAHESHTIWATSTDAKAAAQESLETLVSLLSTIGVALVPDPE
jgi:hypothetical protein